MQKKTLFLLTAVLITAMYSEAQPVTPEHEARARDLVERMTLEEKIDYIGGYNTFFIRPIERLGIPEIRMADGPQGVRNDSSAQLIGRDKKSTLYPCGMAAAATWDRTLVRQMGVGIGQDARARGVHILLGPGVNIYRSPLCGRNFEYFGEDPYLVSETAVSMVAGIQSQGVMACAKHFAANNQEWDRYNVSSDVDERTLHEIYLPSFEKSIRRAGMGAVMSGYHLVNSVHASEYGYLNVEVLRRRWGFKGILMSDWGGTYSTLGPVFNGLDIEMPGGGMMNRSKLLPLIENGVVDETFIDTKVQHILQSLLAFGFFDRPQKDPRIGERNPYSDSVALEVARAGIVLLRNDGLLPLSGGKVLVCGPNAHRVVTGGGSGVVYPFESCSVAEGVRNLGRRFRSLYDTSGWKTDLTIFYADSACTVPGARVEYFNSKDLSGKPAHTSVITRIDAEYPSSPLPGIVGEDYSDRYTFYYKPASDSYLYLSAGGDDGYRLSINGEPIIDDWENRAYRSKDIFRRFEAGRLYRFTYEHMDDFSVSRVMFRYSDHMNDPAFWQALDTADAVIVCVGFDAVTEHEGGDRTFSLPDGQTDLIEALLRRNSKVVVVLNAGGGVEMQPWLDRVAAVIQAWYPGQRGGQAVAEIIAGKVCPSGKLPFTIEKCLEDNPTYGNYHTNVDMSMFNTPYQRVAYNEGIFVGYRGFERKGVDPLFEFGYGLSYTTFAYSDLKTRKTGDGWVVSFEVTNTGRRDGSEVAQLYVGDPEASVPRPDKELKGYEKFFLRRGETRRVEISLDDEAFRYYDPRQHRFVVEPGVFEIMVGASSRDIRLRTRIHVD